MGVWSFVLFCHLGRSGSIAIYYGPVWPTVYDLCLKFCFVCHPGPWGTSFGVRLIFKFICSNRNLQRSLWPLRHSIGNRPQISWLRPQQAFGRILTRWASAAWYSKPNPFLCWRACRDNDRPGCWGPVGRFSGWPHVPLLLACRGHQMNSFECQNAMGDCSPCVTYGAWWNNMRDPLCLHHDQRRTTEWTRRSTVRKLNRPCDPLGSWVFHGWWGVFCVIDAGPWSGAAWCNGGGFKGCKVCGWWRVWECTRSTRGPRLCVAHGEISKGCGDHWVGFAMGCLLGIIGAQRELMNWWCFDFCHIVADHTGNTKGGRVSKNFPTLEGRWFNLLRLVQNDSKPMILEYLFVIGVEFRRNDAVRGDNNVWIAKQTGWNNLTSSAIVFNQGDRAGVCMSDDFLLPCVEENGGTNNEGCPGLGQVREILSGRGSCVLMGEFPCWSDEGYGLDGFSKSHVICQNGSSAMLWRQTMTRTAWARTLHLLYAGDDMGPYASIPKQTFFHRCCAARQSSRSQSSMKARPACWCGRRVVIIGGPGETGVRSASDGILERRCWSSRLQSFGGLVTVWGRVLGDLRRWRPWNACTPLCWAGE